MFHNTVYKFTKVDNLGCGQVAIKNIPPGSSDGNKHFLYHNKEENVCNVNNVLDIF